MDLLFTLYRYLQRNSRTRGKDNEYAPARDVLEPVLDLISSLEIVGRQIRDTGGIEWEESDRIVERTIDHHKTALCTKAGSALLAAIDFAQSHIDRNEVDALITALKAQKEEMQAAYEREMKDNELGDLDDHPF